MFSARTSTKRDRDDDAETQQQPLPPIGRHLEDGTETETEGHHRHPRHQRIGRDEDVAGELECADLVKQVPERRRAPNCCARTPSAR